MNDEALKNTLNKEALRIVRILENLSESHNTDSHESWRNIENPNPTFISEFTIIAATQDTQDT